MNNNLFRNRWIEIAPMHHCIASLFFLVDTTFTCKSLYFLLKKNFTRIFFDNMMISRPVETNRFYLVYLLKSS